MKTDISNSLKTAVNKDTDILRWSVHKTVEQHRQMREAERPILVHAPDLSEDVLRKICTPSTAGQDLLAKA